MAFWLAGYLFALGMADDDEPWWVPVVLLTCWPVVLGTIARGALKK